MDITYIKHSSFSVEFKKAVFIFDYFEGEIPEFEKDKQIYFFVSHKHSDHFSMDIFNYALKYPNITYILSNDLKMNEKYMERKNIPVKARDKIIYACKNVRIEIVKDELTVQTITSTDEGVAYLIDFKEDAKSDVVRLYHAGDLNWWSWAGESEDDAEYMSGLFAYVMKNLEGVAIDIAFVPLDPRLEERFYWGFDYFMRVTKTKLVFPMHCWENYDIIEKLCELEVAAPYRDRVVKVKELGQKFHLG